MKITSSKLKNMNCQEGYQHFGNDLDWHMYNMVAFIINNSDEMTLKEMNGHLYEYIKQNELDVMLDFNFVIDRISYFVKAVRLAYDVWNNEGEVNNITCPVNQNSCSGRHYIKGLEVFNKIKDEIRLVNVIRVEEVEIDKQKLAVAPVRNIHAIANCRRHPSIEIKPQEITYREDPEYVSTMEGLRDSEWGQERIGNQAIKQEPVMKEENATRSIYERIGAEVVSNSKNNTIQKLNQDIKKMRKKYDNTISTLLNAYEEMQHIKVNHYNLTPMVRDYDRTIIVPLADMHYGLVAKRTNEYGAREVVYTPEIAEQRLMDYAQFIIDYAKERHANKVIVCMLGDLIHGDIHPNCKTELAPNCNNVTLQVVHLTSALLSFFEVLSNNVNSVDYYAVSGNHDRLYTQKDKCGEYDNHLVPLLHGLNAGLRNCPNIHFKNKGVDEIAIFGDLEHQLIRLYDYTIEIAHGDGEGNTRLNAERCNARNGLLVNYRIIGHYHQGGSTKYGLSETKVMGSFCDADLFAKKFGGRTGYHQIMMFDNDTKHVATEEFAF